jgi:hypothetical protein
MTTSYPQTRTIYAGTSPIRGEIDSKPVIVDFTPIFEAATADGKIVSADVANVWSAICGHGTSDNKIKKIVKDTIRNALSEGYFAIKGHESYVFFLGSNGSIYAHNTSSESKCSGSDIGGLTTSMGTSPPSRAEVVFSIVSKLFGDWYVESLKKGHLERAKNRAINLNKRG